MTRKAYEVEGAFDRIVAVLEAVDAGLPTSDDEALEWALVDVVARNPDGAFALTDKGREAIAAIRTAREFNPHLDEINAALDNLKRAAARRPPFDVIMTRIEVKLSLRDRLRVFLFGRFDITRETAVEIVDFGGGPVGVQVVEAQSKTTFYAPRFKRRPRVFRGPRIGGISLTTFPATAEESTNPAPEVPE